MQWRNGDIINHQIRSRLGINAGGFLEWFDTPLFSLLSEIAYVQKGMKEDIPITTEQYPDGTGEFINYDCGTNYLSFSLLPKVRYEVKELELHAVAGLRIDYSLSNFVRVDGREPISTYSKQHYQLLFDRFKKTQFGGTFGCGMQLKSLLPFSTGVEIRYSPNWQNSYSNAYMKIKNNSFEFLLTIEG